MRDSKVTDNSDLAPSKPEIFVKKTPNLLADSADFSSYQTPKLADGFQPPQNLLIADQQRFNESLIKLAVLLYQIDGKVTLSEQDYFESLTDNLEWRSGVSLPAFVNDAIHQSRMAIDQNKARDYLFALGHDLNFDAATAFEVAMDITKVDGVRSEEELELLALLSNRVIARGLVS